MGFSIEDATTALAAMSTAGIKGSGGYFFKDCLFEHGFADRLFAAAMDKISLTVTDANGNYFLLFTTFI